MGKTWWTVFSQCQERSNFAKTLKVVSAVRNRKTCKKVHFFRTPNLKASERIPPFDLRFLKIKYFHLRVQSVENVLFLDRFLAI